MKHAIVLLLMLTLVGCAVPYTKSRYMLEVTSTVKTDARKTLEKDDTMAVCLDMDADTIIDLYSKYVCECASEEEDKRPYEFSRSSAKGYAKADALCARKKLITRYRDDVEIDSIPSKYRSRCKKILNEFD